MSRINADQARQRLRPQGSGMRSKAMPLVLIRELKTYSKDRLFIFGGVDSDKKKEREIEPLDNDVIYDRHDRVEIEPYYS